MRGTLKNQTMRPRRKQGMRMGRKKLMQRNMRRKISKRLDYRMISSRFCWQISYMQLNLVDAWDVELMFYKMLLLFL